MIRTYLDNKLISSLKTALISKDKLSKEFDYFKSLYLFLIENKKNELFLAERNIKIEREELESIIKREGEVPFSSMSTSDYVINSKFDFKSINKSTVLIFVDFSDEELNNLEERQGFFFLNCNSCYSKWKKISINNKYAKSVTASFRSHNGKGFNFKETFRHYNFSCNSILISDRYLRGWSTYSIIKNLIPLFESIVPNDKCEKVFLTLFTSEKRDGNYNHTIQSLHNTVNTELSKKYNIELSTICVHEDEFSGVERTEVQNIIHGRHLMTNYLHLASLHSFDINGHNGVKKDTEINVKSLIESSHFSNSFKKRLSYKKLLDKISTNPRAFELIGDYQSNLIFKELLP